MECPKCGSPQLRVLRTKQETGESTVRQRICRGCGHVFFTVEVDLPDGAVAQVADGGLERRPGFRRVAFS